MELAAPTAATAVVDVRVNGRRLVRTFAVAIALLNVANAVSIAAGADTERTRYFLLALERNPSTWVSAIALGLTGAVAWATGRGRPDARMWNVVAGVFAVMSLDEVATFHEWLGAVPLVPGLGNRGWAGAGLLLVALVGVRLFRWVLSLEVAVRVALIVGGLLFVAGAVGFEILAGYQQEAHGSDTLFWILSSVEENLEMIGVVVVLRALVEHLARRTGTLALRVTG